MNCGRLPEAAVTQPGCRRREEGMIEVSLSIGGPERRPRLVAARPGMGPYSEGSHLGDPSNLAV